MIVRPNLFESVSSDNGYGCVMLFANCPDWDKFIRRIVDPADVYDPPEEPGEYGYEEDPHITLLFGLHDHEIIDKSLIYKIIQSIPEQKIEVDTINHFDGSEGGNPYDVVKIDVPPYEDLLNFRSELMELPNTQTFPDYHPHMTVAYVKKGLGPKYDKKFKPISFVFDKGVYSEPDYRKSYFDLKKPNYDK